MEPRCFELSLEVNERVDLSVAWASSRPLMASFELGWLVVSLGSLAFEEELLNWSMMRVERFEAISSVSNVLYTRFRLYFVQGSREVAHTKLEGGACEFSVKLAVLSRILRNGGGFCDFTGRDFFPIITLCKTLGNWTNFSSSEPTLFSSNTWANLSNQK